MIKEFQLKNCQSHKDTLIKLHPGLNVFVGDTDAGKSAMIRGLDKLINNNEPSKSLKSHWGGPLVLSAKVENNKITLTNDEKDSYLLNNTSFSAVGTKVPEEIQQVFNMSDINFQGQDTYFFLLKQTSGYVATYLNKIANISQIDSTTKAIKSELNETKRSIKYDKKNLSKKEETLESYSFLVQLDLELKEAEKLEKEKEDTEFQIKVLSDIILEISELDLAIEKNKKILNLKPIVTDALGLIDNLKGIEAKLTKLKSYEDSFNSMQLELEKLQRLSKLKPLIQEAIELQKKESDFKAKLESLASLMNKVSTIDKRLKIAISNREAEHKLYHSELQKLDKCFFCGSKLN